MRKVVSSQFEPGAVAIGGIVIDPKSRDDIPAPLSGLRHLHAHGRLREKVFRILQDEVNPSVRNDAGRPGMDPWRILALAILMRGLDCDRVVEPASRHLTIRRMPGHGAIKHACERRNVIGNVSLARPALLSRISAVPVAEGHRAVGKKPGETLRGRVDSFCAQTDCRYPTGVNPLRDAMRRTIRAAADPAQVAGLGGWRRHRHVARKVKRLFNRVRASRQSGRSPGRVEEYPAESLRCVERAERTLDAARRSAPTTPGAARMLSLQGFIGHARRQIVQVRLRLVEGGQVPHGEKAFSIFEPHTRWIVKGKAGIIRELGVPACIVEDHHRFILHHRIMREGGDAGHAVALIEEAMREFPELGACGFDRGFHSPDSQRRLGEMLDECALPKKGCPDAEASAREDQRRFRQARAKHPGVESAISRLGHCGLGRVRDHGRGGFARAVALSVLAANCKRLGRALRDKKRSRLARRQRPRAA